LRLRNKTALLYSIERARAPRNGQRREEEKGRREREGDVVIGKTSAVKGADYATDAKATEAEWFRQASKVERKVYEQTDEGMKMLKMLRLEEAATAFGRSIQTETKRLFVAVYCQVLSRRLGECCRYLARTHNSFESKFGMPATEERIWLHACKLKLAKVWTRKTRNACGKQVE
jgi:hypothetical protein